MRKEKTGGTARELEREGSKRRNIAELVGYKDSGREMVRKVEFETAQGSAPTTISVRCTPSTARPQNLATSQTYNLSPLLGDVFERRR